MIFYFRHFFSWDCWLKNHDPLQRVSFFLTAQLRHYSPFWKLFNLLTAPVYCGCCALIGSLLTWPWLALKIDITASLDSGPLSFSLCTILNEKGDRGTVWKRIKRAEDFVSGRFCDRTEEWEKLRRAEDLPPKTEGLVPLLVKALCVQKVFDLLTEKHCPITHIMSQTGIQLTPSLIHTTPHPSTNQQIYVLKSAWFT